MKNVNKNLNFSITFQADTPNNTHIHHIHQNIVHNIVQSNINDINNEFTLLNYFHYVWSFFVSHFLRINVRVYLLGKRCWLKFERFNWIFLWGVAQLQVSSFKFRKPHINPIFKIWWICEINRETLKSYEIW